ncbi:MAG: hypothetical protein COB08_015010 [Rhodobacteraceae bacterium]|nr:hypothetical protein [Paracoccaceae bacterium]
MIIDFDETGFMVEAMEKSARHPSHTLNESADPFALHELGGHFDVTQARYAAQRAVRPGGG